MNYQNKQPNHFNINGHASKATFATTHKHEEKEKVKKEEPGLLEHIR